MKNIFLIATAFLALMPLPVRPADSLYGHAMEKLLNRRFPDQDISYLLVDTPTGELLAARWQNPEEPAPMGSLVKPFTALAYARAHDARYPEYTCAGKSGGCWYAPGHGKLSMAEAIAQSCNAYFRQLAAHLQPRQIAAETRRFKISSPPAQTHSETFVGLGNSWKISPLQMARAYSLLSLHRTDPGTAPLIRGMSLSAEAGTGHAVGEALEGADTLVKTGTAPCVHGVKWSGDGYVMALYPANSPRLTLLIRVHGAPGAKTAATAGKMLQTIIRGDEE